MRAAARLGVPVTASEQYPASLGPTVFDLREWLAPEAAVAKLHFSCADEPAILERLAMGNRGQVILAGIEAHIGLLQSALGLKEKGYEPFVVIDASASRRPESEQAAWSRLRQAGVLTVNLEMVLFEWLRVAGTPAFDELVVLVR